MSFTSGPGVHVHLQAADFTPGTILAYPITGLLTGLPPLRCRIVYVFTYTHLSEHYKPDRPLIILYRRRSFLPERHVSPTYVPT